MVDPGRNPDDPEMPSDEFDDIVKDLDLDWDDPAVVSATISPADPVVAEIPEELDYDDQPDPIEEQLYRQVPPGQFPKIRRSVLLAWLAVLGTPVVLAICTVSGVFLSDPLLVTAGLLIVGGAVYLIYQLPEHGPSRPDWPDDGAEP